MQAPGLSVLEHGRQVHAYYLDLLNHLRGIPSLHTWKVSLTPEQSLWLLQNQADPDTVREYQIYHDCGKPFCLTVDEEGRRHFPNHAAISESTWLQAGGNPQAARLMGMDMDLHTMSAEDCVAFATRPEAATLMLTALAEIHANASMFGGVDSTSFKIKSKHLDRRFRSVFRQLGYG